MKMGIQKSETLTLILVNLAGIMERADESLLPGVYKEVGAALHTDPTGLGSLTLFRSIVQSSCYPLAACLAVRYNRAHVIALGAFLWAAATFLVGISSTFFQVAVSRGLNGIGLAIVIPAIHSLVADSTDEANRGMAFGWLQLTGNIGSIIGGLCAVLMASTSFMGIPGWRIAFHLVALISITVGILVLLFADDPRFSDSRGKSGAQKQHKPFWSEMKDLVKEANSVLKIPSFQIIVAQGIAGSFGGSALSFIPMWLELIGFSHKTVALLWTLFIVGFSLGGLFGGRMGDILAQRYPSSGRIILSQISSASAIPLAAVLLQALPDDPSTAFMHGLVLFAMGLSMSWNAPATNNPIFAEIVPERCRTTIYALDQSFESILSSFAPPLVGILAQHVFGYKPVQNGSTASEEIETDRENAAPLAKALYSAIGIPYLQALPDDPSTAFMHGLVLFAMGLSMSWNAPATNNPIFAEIVPERCRTTIYALDQSFESILSSFAPPLVGILAQHVFGYKPVQNGSTAYEEIETDRENAAPLAKALYSAIGIPYVICCLIYSLLYCTYPRDRERARIDALIASEMEGIVNPPSQVEYSQLGVLESDELQRKALGVFVREFEGEERLDFDENVAKRLLSRELALSDSQK